MHRQTAMCLSAAVGLKATSSLICDEIWLTSQSLIPETQRSSFSICTSQKGRHLNRRARRLLRCISRPMAQSGQTEIGNREARPSVPHLSHTLHLKIKGAMTALGARPASGWRNWRRLTMSSRMLAPRSSRMPKGARPPLAPKSNEPSFRTDIKLNEV